jgi:hypothetical protein
MPTELDNIGRAVEGAADAVVADVVAYVKAHPNYAAIVQALGEKAMQAITAGL